MNFGISFPVFRVTAPGLQICGCCFSVDMTCCGNFQTRGCHSYHSDHYLPFCCCLLNIFLMRYVHFHTTDRQVFCRKVCMGSLACSRLSCSKPSFYACRVREENSGVKNYVLGQPLNSAQYGWEKPEGCMTFFWLSGHGINNTLTWSVENRITDLSKCGNTQELTLHKCVCSLLM